MITHLFGESFFSINFFKNFIKRFAKNDNWHEIDLKTKNFGYGLIHYSLIRVIKPKRILCVGSRYGFIPAMCALACKHNQFGKVDFVDAGFDQANLKEDSMHWGGVGFWKTEKGRKQFNKFGLNNYIIQHIVTTEQFSKQCKQKEWEYIYLDGDHSYKGIKKDFRLFWKKLSKNGFICFHDIHIKKIDGIEYGVYKIWEELIKKNKNKIELPGKYGLGIIQKI